MLMRKAQLIICFCLFSVMVSGQQTYYFNERIDHLNNYDRARNIIENDSGYIIVGITEDSLYQDQFHLTVTQIAKNGYIQWFKEYGYDSINYFMGEPGSLIRFSENKYFSSCSKRIYTEDWVYEQGMLVCYSNEFDTLWTRYYGEKTEPYDTAFFLFQINKTNDDGLIMTGGRKPNGLQTKIWLIKTDSLGNKQWERFYGEGEEYFSGYSVIQTTDGGFSIGAYKFTTGDSQSGDPLIIKTDSLGNEEWRINPGSQYDDGKIKLTLSSSGNIVAGTSFGTEPHGDNRDAKNQLLMIKNDGEVIFNKTYGEPLYDDFLAQVRVKKNGDIVATGAYSSYTPSTPSTIGWVMSVDSNGTKNWYREFTILNGEYSFNYLYDILPTTDKGFIACGQAYPSTPDTGTADIWVLKLDSLGYDTTTVDIAEHLASNGINLSIYPNPVANIFDLNIGKQAKDRGDASVSFYNLFGLKVKEIAIPSGEQSVKVNVSNWQSGLYVAVLRQHGQVVDKRKFVVK